MAKLQLPDQERLQEVLSYDPISGKLYWKPRGVEAFNTKHAARAAKTFAHKYAGKEAFTYVNSDGYPSGMFSCKKYTAHRIIWKLVYGRDPRMLDHINGNRQDNRIENLREVTDSENAKNRRLYKKNVTGVHGVYLQNNNSWYVSIRTNGRSKFIGTYDTFEAAVDARKSAERALGFHDNHGSAISTSTEERV